jgi:hypothetical protein
MFIQQKEPEVNLNQPPVVERTVADELASLINEMENLTYNQINDKLFFLEENLPFQYQDREFTDIDEVKLYIAENLQARTDFDNKDDFMNIFTFLFSSIMNDLLIDEYYNLNNYAYYQQFSADCPQILANDLSNYNIIDYKNNLIIQDTSIGGYDIIEEYYACKATLNKGVCNKISQNISAEEITDEDELESISSYENICQRSSDENLFFYYSFFSDIPCQDIDFSKIANISDRPNCQGCQQLCSILRKEQTDLIELDLSLSERLIAQAYLNNSSDDCEQFLNYDGYDEDYVAECKTIVKSWQAYYDQDLEALNNIIEERDGVNILMYVMRYFMGNLDNISADLDQQVINNNYNYSSQVMNRFCDSTALAVNREVCPLIIEDLQSWFDSIQVQ